MAQGFGPPSVCSVRIGREAQGAGRWPLAAHCIRHPQMRREACAPVPFRDVLVCVTATPTQPRRLALGAWLDGNGRAVTRTEVLSRWSWWSLDAALTRGAAVRILPGVYCGARHATDVGVKAQAVCLWSGRALVSGRAALHLYDDSFEPPTTVEIVLPYGHRVRAPEWIDVREQAPINTWSMTHGVRCVVPECAVLDAWHRSPRGVGRDVVYRALWRRVCTSGQLGRALAAAPRVAGRQELAALLAQFSAGATSPLEVMARREVFAGRHFAEFEWQGEMTVAGRRRRVDLLHRRAGVAVELDGRRYHGTPDGHARDRERDAEFAATGFTTVRFTFDDLRARPAWCTETVLKAVAARL